MKQQEINKLLDQYRLGNISVENRRLLEQLAIEDDFVFDALQGMKEANASSSSTSMDVLRQRLEDRVKPKEKRRISPLWFSGAAAAMLLIVSAVWLLNTKSSPLNEATYAEAKTIEADNEPLEKSTIKDKTKNEGLSQDVIRLDHKNAEEIAIEEVGEKTNANHPPKVAESPAESKNFENVSDNVFAGAPQKIESPASNDDFQENIEEESEEVFADYTNAELADDEIALEENDADSESVPIGDLNSEYSPERARPSTAQASRKKRPSSSVDKLIKEEKIISTVNNYQGKIFDSGGMPLIAASVQIKGTEIEGFTDLDGNIRLENIPPNKSIAIVTYPGFESKQFEIYDDFEIYMEEGTELEEVVVIGNGSFSEASPNIGWDNFKQLIDNQLKLSTLTEIQMNEIIQVDFTVNSDGFPSEIEVIKGKANPKTTILIQLLNTSGKWTSGKGSYSY